MILLHYLFDLTTLGARAEILTKISLLFLGDLKTPKGHFKINWPLKKEAKYERKKKKIGKLTQFIQEKNHTSGINEKNCKKIWERKKQKIPKLYQKLQMFSSALKKNLHFSHIITTISYIFPLYFSKFHSGWLGYKYVSLSFDLKNIFKLG